MWKKIKEQLNIEQDFVANESYPETQLSKIGKTAMKVLSLKDEEFYEGMGRYFVQLAIDIGYEKMLIQLGRGIRDFFLNLDNLHDYLKFTFPKMKFSLPDLTNTENRLKLDLVVAALTFLPEVLTSPRLALIC